MSALDVLRAPLGRQLSIRSRPDPHSGDTVTIDEEDDNMRSCLLMQFQEAQETGLTEEAMAPAMTAFTEQLGGIFVIEVDSLDEAINWAQRNPANG